ncbi:carbohydrate kinase family protein [Pelotomaculum propionicicum]|nr:carbohydrate kinase family protein [Pelotomaculum propionicicum]
MNKNKIVIGQGAAAVDIVIQCQALPEEDGFGRIYKEQITSGGSGANVLVTIAQLGAPAALVAKLGEDEFGRQFRQELMADGVSTQYLLVKPGGATMHTYVFVAEHGKRSILVNSGDSFHTLAPEEVDDRILDDADVLYTDGCPAGVSVKLAKAAKARNIPVFVQIECPPSFMSPTSYSSGQINEVLSYADIICCGRDVYRELATADDYLFSLKDTYDKYKPAFGVICTAGEEGAIWHSRQDTLHCAAYAINPVDTTGAGDSFCGGMIYSFFLHNAGKKDSLAFASACAAIKCLSHGPRLRVSEAMVKDFMNKHVLTCNSIKHPRKKGKE